MRSRSRDVCYSLNPREAGCLGVFILGFPSYRLKRLTLGRAGAAWVAHSGLGWSKSLEATPPPPAPGNWGLETRPLGREPSAQAEPRGSQGVFGGWELQSIVRLLKTCSLSREAEVGRGKAHSFSLPSPHLSPVPGSLL